MTLHKTTTKALLKVLPPVWQSQGRRKRLSRRPLGDVILDLLRAHPGAYLGRADIADYLYGDDEDGDPDFANEVIRIQVYHLRAKGWPIQGHRGRGYFMAAQ